MTISASQLTLPVPVAVKAAPGVIRAARFSPAQTTWTVCPDRQPGGQACVPPAGHNKGSLAQVAVPWPIPATENSFQDFYPAGVTWWCRWGVISTIIVDKSGAVSSDCSGLAMIRAAP